MAKAVSLNKFENISVLLIIFLALVLRLYRLDTDLLFHIDQGLHAIGSWQIWHDHQFKLLGHPTDVDGIFHGPLYYLLMSVPYALSGGNPAVASAFQILLEMLSLPFFYVAIKRLFDRKVALWSLFIYAISYGMIGYSRWLSNVTPIWPLSNFLLYQICKESKREKGDSFIDGLLLGLIIQMNGAVGFGLLPFMLWFVSRKKQYWNVLLLLVGILILAIPQLVFEYRHHFVITKAILSFGSSGKGGFGLPFSTLFINLRSYLEQVNHLISYPLEIISTVAFVIGLLSLFGIKQRKLIILFLLLPLIAFAVFKRGALGFFLVPILPISIAICVNGTKLFGKMSTVILVIFCLINVFYIPTLLSPNNALVPIGSGNVITLQDRLNIIDWTYQRAAGKPFAIWVYTIPYFQEQPWTYLYNWYAAKKYGYLPEQTGSFSPNDLKNAQVFFDYYEPDHDQKYRLESWLTQTQANFGEVTAEYQSHDIYAQQRSWKPAKMNL